MCYGVVWGGFEVVWGGFVCFGVVWGVSTVPILTGHYDKPKLKKNPAYMSSQQHVTKQVVTYLYV